MEATKSIQDAQFVKELRKELKESNCSPNFTEHVVAVEILLSQLRIADSWQWEELHDFLTEIGAWPLMKEKLRHFGWMELLEDVFETSHTAQG